MKPNVLKQLSKIHELELIAERQLPVEDYLDYLFAARNFFDALYTAKLQEHIEEKKP